MQMSSFFKAALIGLAVSFTTIPTVSNAETLKVVRGAPSAALKVPMNRAVVVESEEPYGQLSIANPDIADTTPLSNKSIYVLGKTPGRTTLTLLDDAGGLIANVEVQVTPDVAEFKERLRQILPGEHIEVRTANDGIVLSGTVSSTAKLDRALDLANRYAPDRVSNLMNVGGTQQVMLKVRFAEVQRSVVKELSASFGVAGNDVQSETGTWLGSGILNPGAHIPAPGAVTRTGISGATRLGFTMGSVQFGVLLEALETKGLVRTLAEPNLTALSGQEAKFLAGGEIPIPVAQDNNTITVDWKEFGVLMTFTPRVVDGDIINLRMEAEVSGIDTTQSFQVGDNFTVPAFRTRKTSTTVEMRDGQSFAIAGLLQDDFRDQINQIPWLGDLPVLGALFRSTNYRRDQSELVIIITPHLVTPTRGEALALPTDRVRPPSEKELFIGGKTAMPKGPAGEVARQDFNASYGYVME